MRRPWSGDESLLTKLTDNPRARFRAWRRPRPVFGGLLLIIGGLLIGYVPIQFASELMLIGGAFTVIGLLFAALVTFCGIAVLAKPRLSTIFGVFGVAFSTLSLFGALGGLFVGMIVGTVGGVLSYSWEPPEGYEYDEPAFTFQRTGFIWQEASEFIWHAGPEADTTAADSAAETPSDGATPSADSIDSGADPTLADGDANQPVTADDGQGGDATETTADEWESPADDGWTSPDDGWESPAGDEWGAPATDAAGDESAAVDGADTQEETGIGTESTDEGDAGEGEPEFDWETDDDEDDDIDWDDTDVVDDRFEL